MADKAYVRHTCGKCGHTVVSDRDECPGCGRELVW